MTAPHPLPNKKDVVLELLESTDIFVHLDPRREHVVVPPHFKKQPHLILQIGLNMPVAIPDLEVTDEGISCTLSFNRSPVWCRLPWESIYAVVSNDTDARGMVWPDDVPSEIAFRFLKQGEAKPAPAPAPALAPAPAPAPVAAVPDRASGTGKPRKSKGKGRAKPQPVPEAAPAPIEPAPLGVAADTRKPKRELPPYLRVIK